MIEKNMDESNQGFMKHLGGLELKILGGIEAGVTEFLFPKDNEKDYNLFLEKYFSGPTAAALSSDPITTAKILTKFAKSHEKLKIIAGFMDGKVLDQKEVAIIATLPSLEEARAKIVGILSSPAQKLVSILLAPGSKIANLARAKSLKN